MDKPSKEAHEAVIRDFARLLCQVCHVKPRVLAGWLADLDPDPDEPARRMREDVLEAIERGEAVCDICRRQHLTRFDVEKIKAEAGIPS